MDKLTISMFLMSVHHFYQPILSPIIFNRIIKFNYFYVIINDLKSDSL